MKTGACFFLLFSLVLPLLHGEEPAVELKKPAPKKVVTIVIKKDREYYLLARKGPVEIRVDGPTSLKVHTRLLWREEMEPIQTYKLIVQEDGYREKVVSKTTVKSASAFSPPDQEWGESRYFLLQVPEGEHVYKFSLWEAATDTIGLRFAFAEPKDWVSLVPTRHEGVLEAVEGEKEETYYLATPETSVMLKITGPERLKVVSRLNYDPTTKGLQGYTIVVEEKGVELEKKAFRTYKSELVEYKERGDLIPSKADRLYLDVPKGEHTLDFRLVGTLARSVSLQFLIQEK